MSNRINRRDLISLAALAGAGLMLGPSARQLLAQDGQLVGNVRQWTTTLWGEKRIVPDPKYSYPWKDDGRNDLNASRQVRRVVRGSSMKDDSLMLRCSTRSGQSPDDRGLPGARRRSPESPRTRRGGPVL